MNNKEIAADLIRRTIDILENSLWVQCSLGQDVTNSFCLVSAMSYVQTGTRLGYNDHIVCNSMFFLAKWLINNGYVTVPPSLVGYTYHSFVSKFNDDVVGSKEELIAYLTKFANEMDPQHP